MSEIRKGKGLHRRNPHNEDYDFKVLVQISSELAPFMKVTKEGKDSIDFADAKAVLTLNRAILSHYYGLSTWELPKEYLSPSIPGRADYIHYMADLIAGAKGCEIPRGKGVKVLDIGTGANAIYPIIGTSEYDWDFVASDSNKEAIACLDATIKSNARLEGKITPRLQKDPDAIFIGVIEKEDRFDFTMSFPPLYGSRREATKGTHKKLRNLTKEKQKEAMSAYEGQVHELWCKGGEKAFVTKMIKESVLFASQVKWFSTLVTKKEHLELFKKALKELSVEKVKTIEMKQGNRHTYILAWTFTPLQTSKVNP